jgi:hypothetical protein
MNGGWVQRPSNSCTGQHASARGCSDQHRECIGPAVGCGAPNNSMASAEACCKLKEQFMLVQLMNYSQWDRNENQRCPKQGTTMPYVTNSAGNRHPSAQRERAVEGRSNNLQCRGRPCPYTVPPGQGWSLHGSLSWKGRGLFSNMHKHLEYKPPSSRWLWLLSFLCLYNTCLAIIRIYSFEFQLNFTDGAIFTW